MKIELTRLISLFILKNGTCQDIIEKDTGASLKYNMMRKLHEFISISRKECPEGIELTASITLFDGSEYVGKTMKYKNMHHLAVVVGVGEGILFIQFKNQHHIDFISLENFREMCEVVE